MNSEESWGRSYTNMFDPFKKSWEMLNSTEERRQRRDRRSEKPRTTSRVWMGCRDEGLECNMLKDKEQNTYSSKHIEMIWLLNESRSVLQDPSSPQQP